jgi:hypothetical protein
LRLGGGGGFLFHASIIPKARDFYLKAKKNRAKARF